MGVQRPYESSEGKHKEEKVEVRPFKGGETHECAARPTCVAAWGR